MSTEWWFYRHRRQHQAYLDGMDTSLPRHATERFESEFEAAIKARGAEYKERFDADEERRKEQRRKAWRKW